jgi:3-hydroxy-9,10-secoandrosta-1,3,5(10)-triene-9,17-dione monooxygenase
MELARGCPSSAWVVAVLGLHPFEFGLLDPRCGDELWGENSGKLVSSSAPFGTVERVEGGYRLNGQWKTSSGCDHADGGAFVGGRVANAEGKVQFRSFWVQPERLHDHRRLVCGGPGRHRQQDAGARQCVRARTPQPRDRRLWRGNPRRCRKLYKMPFFYVFYAAISSVIIGMARGMVDLYIDHMVPRQNINQAIGAAVKDPFIKGRLGEAEAKILGATARVLHNTSEAYAYAARQNWCRWTCASAILPPTSSPAANALMQPT